MAGVASAIKLAPAEAQNTVYSSLADRRTSFDSKWLFTMGDPQGASDTSFRDDSWRQLDLPHDWSIEGTFDEHAPDKGTCAYLPTGVGWYRKSFTVPASKRPMRVVLEFDGIYQRSEVWINGVSLGMRPYGFIGFAYDLTPHLTRPGRPNQIAVRVDNSLQPNCRWYSGSGIYRHTWLRITDPLHIARSGVFVRATNIASSSATLEITTRIANQNGHTADLELTTEIVKPDGVIVQRAVVNQSIAGAADEVFAQTLTIPSPELWSNTTPNLYHARSTVRVHGEPVDVETTSFGIRDVKFDVDRGFLLNGEHIKLNGVCIHGDGGSVGTAVPEGIWQRRLELLKTMGCNAIRLSHNPPAPELLDMLDRMGFLVMAEAFDEWRVAKGQTPDFGYHKYFDEWSDRDLIGMLERDRNHPSIVIWSAGNEVPDQSDLRGPETLQHLMDVMRREDPSRLITVACDEIVAEPKAALPEFLNKLDVVGYNYVDRWRDRREKYYSIDRHDYPRRRFIGTESTALYGSRGVYNDETNDLFFEKTSNTIVEVEQQQKFIQTYDYVSGDFIWAGIDYLGEAHWPNKLAATGALDTCGFPKDNFYFYQSIWTREPVLHLFPHWNWPGREGRMVPVSCYTNCDAVELFLNGESLGIKGYAFPRPGMTEEYGHYPPRAKALQTTADLHLTWDVPYRPGALTAKGIRDGSIIKVVEVHTTGSSEKIALVSDRVSLGNNPGEVAHITVQVQDAKGQIVPTANDALSFDIEGPGRIVGVDNGQPDSHESYKSNTRRAFGGLALVIVQSTGRRGSITLTASGPSIAPARIEITTVV